MVSTRHHPKQFPEPTTPGRASPTKQTATTTSTTSSSPPKSSAVEKSPPTKTPTRRRTAPSAASSYVHAPDPITIGWLVISLILVAWDTGYVFLRPHSMTGGFLSKPIWTPYQLYATVDHMYGFPAWNEGNGFTAAQAALNFVESVMYLYYLAICWIYGGGAKGFEQLFRTGQLTVQGGPPNAVSAAVLVCFSSAVMTVSKTLLYCKSRPILSILALMLTTCLQG